MHKQHAAATTGFHKHSLEGRNGNGQHSVESPSMKVPATFCPEGVDPFDTVEWERRSAQIKDENGESFYRVYLRTNKNSLERHGKVLPIIPGMTATAEILTGKKTVLEYILKPILKARDRALRER